MYFTLLTICTIFFGLIYQCVLRYWNYFNKNNIKFVRGFPFLGVHYKALTGKIPLATSFANVYNHKYPNEGIIGSYELGGIPAYGIRDPDLIKQMVIKDFDHFVNHQFHIKETSDPVFGRTLFFMRDQRWRDMRSILSPAFTSSKMKLMFNLIVENCQTFCEHLNSEIGDDGKIYDFNDLTERFANDVIANCAFGIKIDSMKDTTNEFFKLGRKLARFEGIKGLKFIAYAVIPQIMNYFKIKVLEENEANYFRKILLENMKYREQNNIVRNDMVNLLLEAKKGTLKSTSDDDDSKLDEAKANKNYLESNVKQKWSDDDLLAQTIIFFIAGFGTVSKTLAFAAHETTVNSNVQDKLYVEVNETEETLNGKALSYDILQNLNYVDMIMSETLRKWPQVPGSTRRVNKPYVIDDYKNGRKIQLNINDIITIPTQAIHMDSQFFPNPEHFDPERFSEENKSSIISGTYLPFGIGPRICIGTRFALMECKAFLYYLILNFHLEKCDKTQDPMRLKCGPITADAENGFWIKIRKRQK